MRGALAVRLLQAAWCGVVARALQLPLLHASALPTHITRADADLIVSGVKVQEKETHGVIVHHSCCSARQQQLSVDAGLQFLEGQPTTVMWRTPGTAPAGLQARGGAGPIDTLQHARHVERERKKHCHAAAAAALP